MLGHSWQGCWPPPWPSSVTQGWHVRWYLLMSCKQKVLGLKGPSLPIRTSVPPLWVWYLEDHQPLVTMRKEVTC